MLEGIFPSGAPSGFLESSLFHFHIDSHESQDPHVRELSVFVGVASVSIIVSSSIRFPINCMLLFLLTAEQNSIGYTAILSSSVHLLIDN